MKIFRKISLFLATVTVLSAVACSAPQTENTGVTASDGAEKYAVFLAEHLGDSMPDSTVIAMGEDTAKYGVDLSGFADDEGYTVKAVGGDVVILGKTEASLDRAVRQYVNYGNPDDYSYTYGEGYRVGDITIGGVDISEYKIMLPEENDECHTYAADNLREYIGRACGIYPETVEYSADAEGSFIRLVRAYPEDEMYSDLGDEGFTITVADGSMTVYGGHYRGCMYGVFDFLEQYIGWRFFTDPSAYGNYTGAKDIDYLYEADHIDIPAGTEYTETADIAVRHNIFRGTVYGTEDHRAKRKINSNLSKNKNTYGLIGFSNHGLLKAIEDDMFRDFNLSSYSQPCFTDEEFIDVCKEYFTFQTQSKINAGQVPGKDFINIDVAQFDTDAFCLCENCAEYYILDGGNVGPVLYFTNTMARHLGAEFGDEIQISMFAYWGTSSVPKVTRPDPNVNVSFCFFTEVGRGECHSHPISGEYCTSGGTVSNKIYGEQLLGWSEIAETLTVWYYPGYWCQTSVTVPFIRVLREDIAFLKECGVDGIYVCVAGYDMASEKIIPYLVSNLVWDADMTEDEYTSMVEEYYRIVYGDGYKYLLEYENRLNEYVYDTCWSTNVFSNVLDKICIDRVAQGFFGDIALFDKARSLAGTEWQERRIEELSLSMYFTGLASSYDMMWENGDDTMRAEYAKAWDTFAELAVKHGYYFVEPFAYNGDEFVNVAEIADEFAEPFDMFEHFEFKMKGDVPY